MEFFKKYSKHAFLFIFLFLTVLGVIGYEEYSIINSKGFTFIECLLKSLRLYGFGGVDLAGDIPLSLQMVRFLAPITTLSGLFLGFKKSIADSFDEVYRWMTILKIKTFKDHIIICGLSKKAQLLIDNLLKEKEGERPNKVVLIESNANHQELPAYLLKGVHVIVGSATEESMLLKANVLKAKCIVALTDKDDTNIEISKKLSDVYKKHFLNKEVEGQRQIKSIIHLYDYFHLQAFKDYHEIQIAKGKSHNSLIDFHAINIYQKAAQRIVDLYAPDHFIKISNPEDPAVEIMIMGLSHAGENILIEAAFIYHFFNLKKLKVYIVDHEVEQKLNKLINFIPPLRRMLDIVTIDQTDFLENNFSEKIDKVSVCFIAKVNDGESVYYSKKIKQLFYNINKTISIPKVVVVLPKDTKILNLLEGIERDSKNKLVDIDFINIYEGTCTQNQIIVDEENIDEIAKLIHYAYSKNENTKISEAEIEELWGEINDGLKDSNRFSARHLKYKLRFLNLEMIDRSQAEKEGKLPFNFDDLDDEIHALIIRLEHQRWMYEKLLNGYSKCEDVNDSHLQQELKNKLKLHKDFDDINKLDEETKKKDISAFLQAEQIAKRLNKVIVKI